VSASILRTIRALALAALFVASPAFAQAVTLRDLPPARDRIRFRS
jgi:hypothetical protein